MVSLTRNVPGKPANQHENQGHQDLDAFQNRRMSMAIVICFTHHDAALSRKRRSAWMETKAIATLHRRTNARRLLDDSLSVQRAGGMNMATTRWTSTRTAPSNHPCGNAKPVQTPTTFSERPAVAYT